MKAKDVPFLLLGALTTVVEKTEESAETLIKKGKESKDMSKLIENLEKRAGDIRQRVRKAVAKKSPAKKAPVKKAAPKKKSPAKKK